jgi:hypothetical protein
MAAGFVGLVIDATASIANSEIAVTPLSRLGQTLFPTSFPGWENAVSQTIHPYLWNPVILTVLKAPAAIAGFVLGALLLWLGRKRPEPVGYQADT